MAEEIKIEIGEFMKSFLYDGLIQSMLLITTILSISVIVDLGVEAMATTIFFSLVILGYLRSQGSIKDKRRSEIKKFSQYISLLLFVLAYYFIMIRLSGEDMFGTSIFVLLVIVGIKMIYIHYSKDKKDKTLEVATQVKMSDQKKLIAKEIREHITGLIISIGFFVWIHIAKSQKEVSMLADIGYFITPIMAIIFLIFLILDIRKYFKNSKDDDSVDELLD